VTFVEFLISQLPQIFFAVALMGALTTIGLQINDLEINEGTI